MEAHGSLSRASAEVSHGCHSSSLLAYEPSLLPISLLAWAPAGGRQMINSTAATLEKRLGPKPLRESEELSVPLCCPSKDPTGD